tara:strand:- start:128 stop:538 length:411 start_codon:yes stop_codon:yes gene_type:complete
MVLSSNTKKKILDSLENKLDMISSKTQITKREIGIIIRLFHSMMPVLPLLTVLFVSKKLVLFHIIFLIMIMTLFYFFNGCLLSLLEYRLIKDDYSVADPFLKLILVEITNETRKKYTIITFIGILLYFIFVYNIKK